MRTLVTFSTPPSGHSTFPPASWSSSTSTYTSPSGQPGHVIVKVLCHFFNIFIERELEGITKTTTGRNTNRCSIRYISERHRCDSLTQVSSKEEATDGKIELSVIVQPDQEENPAQEIETVGTVVKAREEKEIRSKINWCCW